MTRYSPESIDYIVEGDFAAFLPSLDIALSFYPDNPAQGSPYDPVGASPTDRFYGSTNQYKRISSLLGDTIFQSGRSNHSSTLYVCLPLTIIT